MVDSITRSISSTTGSFIQVYADVEPRPWLMCTDLITASGAQVVADLAVDPARHERLEHRDQPVRGEFVDRACARRQRRDRAGIVEIDAAQHLSAVHPRGRGGLRGGRRSSGRRARTWRRPGRRGSSTRRPPCPPAHRAAAGRRGCRRSPARRPRRDRPAPRAAGQAGRCGCSSRWAASRRPVRRGPGGRRRRSSAGRCRGRWAGWCGPARRGAIGPGIGGAQIGDLGVVLAKCFRH